MVHYQKHMNINHWAEEHLRYLGERGDLFVVAYMADEPVGLVTLDNPDESAYISFIAVIPDHRGNGYANDLVRHGTKLALEAGWGPPIRAQTDLINVPMRAAFTRHGYEEEPQSRTWGHLLNF
jgi:ribosomal protein S18 acetylase RimI-like enzyme